GDCGGHGVARSAETAFVRGCGDRAHEPGRLRRFHGKGTGQVGTRGEGSQHQAGGTGDRTEARMKLHLLMLKAVGALLALTSIAAAQDYPSKPVRVIIPFPPGGVNDTVGRLVATQLSTRLGKQFIVDNRGGAGGTVGTELAANAPKDGYTLLVISLAPAVHPWLYKLPYDPIKAFAPVAIVASAPNVITVHPSLPVHSVKELVALAKEKPGQVQYASAGVGSFMHLGGELFKLSAGINLLHVP